MTVVDGDCGSGCPGCNNSAGEEESPQSVSNSRMSKSKKSPSSPHPPPLKYASSSCSNPRCTEQRKAGRKGDPRMHCAVAARLKNPKLSLFDALQAGGFHYPTDDDAGLIDNEQVTLGQRKNQLSRRLRLARNKGMIAAAQQRQPSQRQEPPAVAAAAAAAGMNNVHNAGPHPHLNHNPGPNPAAVSPPPNASGMGSNSSSSTAPADQLQRRRLAAEQLHSNYYFGPPANRDGIYNFHPPPPNGQNNAQRFVRPPVECPLVGASAHHPAGAAAATAVAWNDRATTTMTKLYSTAHSMGLTLDQLATTLNNSSNLHQLFAADGNNNGDGTKGIDGRAKRREILALNLYQNESRALYQKCMLMAGYPAEECTEGSIQQVRFVTAAYQVEGKRLQEYLSSKGETVEAITVANAAQAATKQHKVPPPPAPGGNNNNNNNGKKTDSASCSPGSHIHRLGGECGHRAILHQPDPGIPPHIDFVVGDKVECYGGNPLPASAVNDVTGGSVKGGGVWFSKYKCEELNCRRQCDEIAKNKAATSNNVNNDTQNDSHEGSDKTPTIVNVSRGRAGSVTSSDINNTNHLGMPSRIFELQDLDLTGSEWNLDVSSVVGDSSSLPAMSAL